MVKQRSRKDFKILWPILARWGEENMKRIIKPVPKKVQKKIVPISKQDLVMLRNNPDMRRAIRRDRVTIASLIRMVP
jgi:hypothetical protein